MLNAEINEHVPINPYTVGFRADLAGLLVVSIVASYESCVKDTLINFASKHHLKFEKFVQNQFKRLNSRIGPSDLYLYARTFDNNVHDRFGKLIKAREEAIVNRTGQGIVAAYKQILSWRHDFAHDGVKNTTLEEALRTHSLAKRVLYIFDEAFDVE